jgi:acetylcholinesterase
MLISASILFYLKIISYILNNNQILTKQINDLDSTNKAHHNYSEHRHEHNRAKHSRKTPTTDDPDNLIVHTQSGHLRGRLFYVNEHLDEKNKTSRVDAWLGIPFAEKPIGDLKFKRPVPIKGWDGILNATELPNTCYQLPDLVLKDFAGSEMWNPNTNVSEDCLYLNIWVPHPRPRNAAVMVWIFGGGFNSGSSTLKVYDPKIFVAETQVILVAMQYRLGFFGFLFLDHPDVPGNQGLLDQNLALKWVHNNIQYFGGDNRRITLYGESAGAVSVSLHLLSRLSSNLFTNAIMQSGSAIADWATLKNSEALKRGREILVAIGCDAGGIGGNLTYAIECAQSADPIEAMQKSDEYFYNRAIYGIAQYNFLPVVDDYFLEEEPIISLNRGQFKKCPILTGVNKDEGNWFFVYSFKNFRDYFNITEPPVITYNDFEEHMSQLFHFYPQYPYTASPLLLRSITHRYTYWNNVNDSFQNRENLDNAAADFHFVCPVVDLANQYALYGQKVFFYHYTHRSSKHYWPDWLGVMHADEIGFVFGEPLNKTLKFNDKEKVFTRRLIKYWSNFAKYGDVNGHSEYDNATVLAREGANRVFNEIEVDTKTLSQEIEYWPLYKIGVNTDKERIHMRLDAYKTEFGSNHRAEYCAFWGKFVSDLALYEGELVCWFFLFLVLRHFFF